MSRNALFQPPVCFTRRLEDLKEAPELDAATARLLMQVELGFTLMELLHLDDEPITSVWAILSGFPIRHYRLQNLNEKDRRAIANARQLVPFSARFAWINALRTYREIDQSWRNYDLEEDEEALELSERFISEQKIIRQPLHQRIYEECLQSTLRFRERELKAVVSEDTYQFKARTEEASQIILVKFPQEQLLAAQQHTTEWFTVPCSKKPVSFTLEDLVAEAEYLDCREDEIAQRYGWAPEEKGKWRERIKKIDLRSVSEDLSVAEKSDLPVVINGLAHVPGMVGSGKSTFALLLASYLHRNHAQQRIALVVGDVQSAVKLANQINGWFCDDPEVDTPAATVILGKGQQDKNRRNFLSSDDYREHQKRGQPHWGERWLNPACPLQSLLDTTEIQEKLNGLPLIPGDEPCHSLKKVPRGGMSRKLSGPSYGCPFFSTCPSKQAYRDLPKSNIWITTPGAIAMAGLPLQLDLRPIKVGELVYEQSNIVVFDEIETVSQWFDGVYAKDITLVNEKDGVFDEVSVPTEEYMRDNRVPPILMQRWTGAERDALKAITATLTMLDPKLGHQYLQDWVARGYFTPFTLMFRLSRRLVGLPEFDPPDSSESDRTNNLRLVKSTMAHFEMMMEHRLLEPRRNTSSEVKQLLLILQQINNAGGSAADKTIHRACRAWIEDVLSQKNLPQQNNPSAEDLPASEDEDIETLAYRLQFALTVHLLDRHARTVFYEWQNSPPTINDDFLMQRRMPSAMMNILPLPVTGRQFGTYVTQTKLKTSIAQSSNTLSLFAYANIGRNYVLNFHRLLTDFCGQRGPSVLALSGTSFLPHSTQFHFEALPQAVLLPEESAREAISQSAFEFLPQYKEGKPIRISGQIAQQRMGLFKDVARALVRGSGHLQKTLTDIVERGASCSSESKRWGDRDRLLLLVNSYEQARWAANELHQCWPDYRGKIYHLVRSSDVLNEHDSESDDVIQSLPLRRSDIESFAQTGGKILVAPMNAIGRGFNILNSHGKAAFGAVYFLTRSYPHPQDTVAIARELNRRASDWLEMEDFEAWIEDGVGKQAEALRRIARTYWRSVEQRAYYRTLVDDDERPDAEEKLGAFPRKDLAATTVGLVIQAVGRLLRGGVPFQAYFVDAAWAPKSASSQGEELDTDKTSLLAAMIPLLGDYVHESEVSSALYKPLAEALENIEGMDWELSR